MPLTLRLLPGSYSDSLSILVTQTTPQRVVGTGSTLTSAFEVAKGAVVEARNMTLIGSGTSDRVSCGKLATDAISSLKLSDFKVSIESTTVQMAFIRCNATLERGEIDMQMFGDGALLLNEGTNLVVDRLYVHSQGDSAQSGFAVFDRDSTARVTNSVFLNAGVQFSNLDTVAGAEFFFAYNTWVMTHQAFVNCNKGSSTVLNARFENNIIFSTTTDEPLLAPNNCTLVGNIVAPFAGSLPGNIIANPRLVDAPGGDYHLQPSSPALDAAVPSQVSLDVDHDFEGTIRPQGAKPDIGALELH
ncbi:MAG TPA: choice-of-anchor Q domain-containing protein [Kofleriaceae bacterium]|nr:choice-of-anchor Q domain-containing protein [Kofleriaceae bacterium]